MAAFDAELYLRLAGERELATGSSPHHHEMSPLTIAAQALVAARVLDRDTADAVLVEYWLALAARGDQMSLYAMSENDDTEDDRPAAAKPIPPARVVACERTVEISSGTLHIHHVTLSEQETTLAVTLRFAAPAARRRGRGLTRIGGGGPHGLTLADDRGTRRTTHFGGGGSEHEWTGHYTADPGLAIDTAYIEVDGERIELDGEVPAAEVWIEELEVRDPVIRYLWGCVTPGHGMHELPMIEPAIDALVAAGALDADDPGLADIRAVVDAIGQGMLHGAPLAGTNTLPEPWRSVIRRTSRQGPTGTLAVSAVTPVFDGFSVAIRALVSDEYQWEIAAEVSPDIDFMPFGRSLGDAGGLTWWARDERGNHFLGSMGSWSGGGERGRGEIQFGSALDRKASYVDVLPTASTQRAVIRVPLEWPA
jgi:hypothetical protein